MADKDLKIVISAIDKATAPIKSMGNSLKGVLSDVSSAMFSLGKVGAVAIAGLGAVGLKTAGDFEQTSISFKTMLGDADKASALLKELSSFAASTPFEFPEIANAGKSLLAFGVEAGNVKSTLTTLGDIASSLNIPLGELSEIYGKIKTSGRVFAEDINQLTGRGIPIIAELAKQFGVAEGEVKNLVEKGKVGFPEIQKAMESMAGEGGKFAGGMVNQSQSLNGLLSTAKDGLGNILNEIIGINQAGEITKGSILEGAKAMITGMIDFLNKNTENIKLFFENVKTSFSEGFAIIKEIAMVALTFIQDFWKKNGENIINSVQITISAITEFWKKYGDDISLVMKGIGLVVYGAFILIRSTIESVMWIIGPLIQDTLTVIGGAFQILIGILTLDFAKAWEGVKNVVSGVVQVVGDIILAFVDLITRAFGTDIVAVVTKTMDWLKIKAQETKQLVSDILASTAKVGQSFSIQGVVSAVSGGTDGARALGGPVYANRSYLVGENGPEIFSPGSSGRINNNPTSNSPTININLGGVTVTNSADEDRLVEKIQKALIRQTQLYSNGIA